MGGQASVYRVILFCKDPSILPERLGPLTLNIAPRELVERQSEYTLSHRVSLDDATVARYLDDPARNRFNDPAIEILAHDFFFGEQIKNAQSGLWIEDWTARRVLFAVF